MQAVMTGHPGLRDELPVLASDRQSQTAQSVAAVE